MLKKTLFLLTAAMMATLSLSAGECFLRPKFQMAATAPGKTAPENLVSYPLFVRCSVIEEFSLFPVERGEISFFADDSFFYLAARLQDSEVICQAQDDGGRLELTGDCLMILLKEENSPLLWEYLLSPSGRKSLFLYRGRERTLQTGTPLLPFEAEITIDGKINDEKRDRAWSAVVKIPLEEFRKQGFRFGGNEKWLIQVQRVNFSRFIPKRDVSGAPQNCGDQYQTELYAELLLPESFRAEKNKENFTMQRSVEKIWEGRTLPFASEKDAALTEHFMENPAPDDGVDRYIDVTEPLLYHFPVTGPAPHPAILVCPGGGYHHLAWNSEGLDIASYFNGCGFSAFVLKYRCPDRRAGAIADGVRAMRYIRANAARFGIDPERLGVIGFSAGGHLAANLSAPENPNFYEAADAVDAFSFRPDFSMLIYPAYLGNEALQLAPEFSVTPQVPPTFLVQAEDDWVNVECSLGWYLALKKAGVPAEMHLFAEGGHGYGLRRTGKPVSDWGEAAVKWLRRQTQTN